MSDSTGVPLEYWPEAYESGAFLNQWDYSHPSEELIGALTALTLPSTSRVLDLGCGGGRDAIYMASLGFDVVGVDVTVEAIAIAQRRAEKARVHVDWIVDDVLELSLPSETFDLITDRACFHHIPHAVRPKYAEQVFRLLKPGGVFLVRGCKEERAPFFPVTESEVGKHFSEDCFRLGSFLPIFLQNNSGGLTANMGMLRKISALCC